MHGKTSNLLESNSVVSDLGSAMTDNHDRLKLETPLEQTLSACPDPGICISPLGWSIKGRLLAAAAAAALLWLAVAWALGWLW